VDRRGKPLVAAAAAYEIGHRRLEREVDDGESALSPGPLQETVGTIVRPRRKAHSMCCFQQHLDMTMLTMLTTLTIVAQSQRSLS
jgi:hypothetical protein